MKTRPGDKGAHSPVLLAADKRPGAVHISEGDEKMQCPSCGFQIDQQNMERCPSCGRMLSYPPAADSVWAGEHSGARLRLSTGWRLFAATGAAVPTLSLVSPGHRGSAAAACVAAIRCQWRHRYNPQCGSMANPRHPPAMVSLRHQVATVSSPMAPMRL